MGIISKIEIGRSYHYTDTCDYLVNISYSQDDSVLLNNNITDILVVVVVYSQILKRTTYICK